MDDRDISELRALYPLPPGQPGGTVNRTQLAIAMDVSEPTLSKWLGQGMPCVEEGGHGREYVFDLADCYAWRRAREVGLKAERDAATSASLQMASLFRNLDEDDPSSGMSADEIARMSDADFRWQRAAEGRKDLIRATRVREMVETMLVELRNTFSALPDWAEMEFGLSPDQVQKMERRCDDTLVSSRRALEALLARDGEVVAMERPEVSGA